MSEQRTTGPSLATVIVMGIVGTAAMVALFFFPAASFAAKLAVSVLWVMFGTGIIILILERTKR